ncbi:hypothetical protein E0500_018800 [Streptomyces sp. KM273126]|uniref:hypothetical protein n=1 Tax=Streptomyces sp. KM273126 TaxID=2545247 RepID=UPI00103BE927|nr:hypothetical protein [Streptomyces sp. KM273126]MBA2809390.1 hypothetical protein [Streptomyces sp. KM273126]
MNDGGLRMLGPAIFLGKVVAWVACLLMTVLLGCWLFLVKSTLRDALVLGCAVVLAVLAVSAWALRRASGNPDSTSVYRALADRTSEAGESGPGALPGRLRGASALLNEEALKLYGGVMALVLPLALGVGAPTPTGKAAEIASSGAVVRALPVESVRDVVRDRHRNGSTYYCTVTVLLPPADGAGSGRRVAFRSQWPDPAVVGGKAYVAYAPDRPELGAVGDNDRADVDRQLSGRTMSNWWTWILRSGWLFLIGVLFFVYLTGRRDQQFPRRLRGNERVLRASISGYDGHGAGKAHICLDTSKGPVKLHVHGDNARYVDTVGRAEGHLVWAPDRNRHGGRKGPHRTGAVFISDAGWFIPGGLAPEYEESARAKAGHQASVGSTGERRLLDLDGGWILSIPNRLMNVLLLWTLCVVALALPVPSATWRLVVGIAGTVGLLVYGLYVVVSQDPAAQGQLSSGQGARGAAP